MVSASGSWSAKRCSRDLRLLCCDEPTSGLDSATACVVVEALRDLARERRVAVVASIHQPSSRLFLLFDELLLLRKGGLTYRGSTSDAGDAFAGAPFHLPCPRPTVRRIGSWRLWSRIKWTQ